MHPQKANFPLQGLDRHVLKVGAISGSYFSPPLASFYQSWIYMVGEKHSGEADKLTLTTGAVNML